MIYTATAVFLSIVTETSWTYEPRKWVKMYVLPIKIFAYLVVMTIELTASLFVKRKTQW